MELQQRKVAYQISWQEILNLLAKFLLKIMVCSSIGCISVMLIWAYVDGIAIWAFSSFILLKLLYFILAKHYFGFKYQQYALVI